MFGKSLAMVAVVLPLGLFADWETNRWMQVADVSFETYATGDRLNETNGAHHGHWESDKPIKDLGFATETAEGVKYMHLETSSNLTFAVDRPGRAGGGNVLLFSVQMTARQTMEDLSPDSKGGFAVATNDVGEASFCGWAAGGWRVLKAATVTPVGDGAWYDCAMRFRVTDGGLVQVQYLIKGDAGYEVLSDGGTKWLDTNITNGDASVSAIDFKGKGGLERLSSREKNGFSVRLR